MEKRRPPSADDSRFKVLIVDDHPHTARMLARAISHLGPRVEAIPATSGREALRYVENGTVDILITDLMMPEMSGTELIEVLNNQPPLCPAATFLLTAYDSAATRETARRLHVREVIVKPAHPEQICELILQTIDELQEAKPGCKDVAPNDALNISSLLYEVTTKFQTHADQKAQLLIVEKTEPAAWVRGNSVELRQVLLNLVWTAIQITRRGGTVILSSNSESNLVSLSVRDGGCEDSAPLDAPSIAQDLAFAKFIVEAHGGNLTVDNGSGKGTRFIVSLPLVSIDNSITGPKDGHSSQGIDNGHSQFQERRANE